jgi:hypothetical protein
MRAQPVNFKKGKDPKETLGIGVSYIISEITSDDLELLGDLLDDEKGIVPYENWYEDHGEDYEDDQEAKESYNRLYKIALAIGDKIQWGLYFDHHEEYKMEHYLENPPAGFPYIYNSYPDSDGWGIVWSSIYLPSAEEIEL